MYHSDEKVARKQKTLNGNMSLYRNIFGINWKDFIGQKWRQAERYTRVSTLTDDSHVRGQTVANFWIEASDVNVLGQRELRLDVEALEKCQCRATCASLWRQPSPFAMRRTEWSLGERGRESTDFTL